MAATGFNTVIVRWPNQSGPKFYEKLAAAAINPGELLDVDSNGDLILNADAVGTIPIKKWVAVESPMADTSIATAAIDQDYASGDTVRYIVPPQGAELYMWLASGENVAEGAELTSDGAGALEAINIATTESSVAFAAEAVDASASRLRIRAQIA